VGKFSSSLGCGNNTDKRNNVIKIKQAITEDVSIEERDKLSFLLPLHVFAKRNQGIDNLMKQTF
jgi:hypothetical protein